VPIGLKIFCVSLDVINLNQFPFVRILIPFVIGILIAVCYEYRVIWILRILPLLVLIYSLMVMKFYKKVSYRYRWVTGIFINSILVLSGYQMTIDKSFNIDQRVNGDNNHVQSFVLQLEEDPAEKLNSFKSTAHLLAVRDSLGWIVTSEKVLLYFQKGEEVRKLCYGDQLYIQARLQEVKGPQNPGGFNYKQYLRFSGIKQQVYVKQDQWVQLDSTGGSKILGWSKQVRRRLFNILQANGIEGKEYALASAILLGYDEHLDAEQKRQFSGAGAMHILCVSGLHVGIIAVVLNSLLMFLNRNHYLKILKLILLILFIWVYAAITGFSPSVLRAATMFSFIYAGRFFKRNISIYNMLAASAFLLLVIDPYMITKVGFQLSYLAVAGIVLLYTPIYNLLITNNVVIDRVWQLSVVSLAATLATFPLSLFYFHQFPNLFLVTNLVAIPASFLIVYSGMLLMALSFIPVISGFIGQVLSIILSALNFTVGFLEGLSFSTTRHIHLSTPELLLFMGVIIRSVHAESVINRVNMAIVFFIFIPVLKFKIKCDSRNNAE